jgi:hypothetical protein
MQKMQNEKDYSSIKSLHDHLFKWGRANPDDAGMAGDGHAGWAADGATYVGSAAHCGGSTEGGNVEEAEKGGMREEGKEKGHIHPHLICTGA